MILELFLIAGLATSGEILVPRAFVATVIDVHDGDTVTVQRHDGSSIKVRLEGIDCPELGQAYGNEARAFATQKTLNEFVVVDGQEWDKYGRLVGRVLVGSEDLSEELLRAGLAWHFLKYNQDADLAELEKAARAASEGLWADPSPTAPWDYRHGSATPSPATARAADQDPDHEPATPTRAGPLHGNRNSHVYHRPGCPQYNCKNCTRIFATAAEAEAAGFRPAGCCNRSSPRSPTTPKATRSQRVTSSPAPATGPVVHGNSKSHVYHRPGCRNYNCKNCTRIFSSPAEAEAAGYRPAGCCH